MKHNNVLLSGDFRKHWENYVRTWFNQPARKTRRRNGFLYCINASTLSAQWNNMGPFLQKTVESLRLFPPTEDYVPPYKDPGRFCASLGWFTHEPEWYDVKTRGCENGISSVDSGRKLEWLITSHFNLEQKKRYYLRNGCQRKLCSHKYTQRVTFREYWCCFVVVFRDYHNKEKSCSFCWNFLQILEKKAKLDQGFYDSKYPLIP